MLSDVKALRVAPSQKYTHSRNAKQPVESFKHTAIMALGMNAKKPTLTASHGGQYMLKVKCDSFDKRLLVKPGSRMCDRFRLTASVSLRHIGYVHPAFLFFFRLFLSDCVVCWCSSVSARLDPARLSFESWRKKCPRQRLYQKAPHQTAP